MTNEEIYDEHETEETKGTEGKEVAEKIEVAEGIEEVEGIEEIEEVEDVEAVEQVEEAEVIEAEETIAECEALKKSSPACGGAVERSETEGAETEEGLPKLPFPKLCAAIESILFAFGHSVELSALTFATGETEENINSAIDFLEEEYKQDNRGIIIQRLEKKVQLTTKKEYYPQLIRLAANPKKPALTQTVLETLSIIAYKQPVTRGDVERIRGVKCDFAINKLVEYGLIEEVGRLDAPGRPILFATTEEFLRRYGMSSISNLPQASPEEIDEFLDEAKNEIPLTT